MDRKEIPNNYAGNQIKRRSKHAKSGTSWRALRDNWKPFEGIRLIKVDQQWAITIMFRSRKRKRRFIDISRSNEGVHRERSRLLTIQRIQRGKPFTAGADILVTTRTRHISVD